MNSNNFANTVLSIQERNLVQRINNNQSLNDRQKERRITAIYLFNEDVVNYVNDSLAESEDAYGIMNYGFSLPILLTVQNLTWSLSYTYSIPVNLPGETTDWSPIGYFGTSLSYRIPLK